MQEIRFFILAIVTGPGILAWSADRFVVGASGLAQSFGTSAPEMLVSTMAAWQGNSGIAGGGAEGWKRLFLSHPPLQEHIAALRAVQNQPVQS